jgi:hypothetical protein
VGTQGHSYTPLKGAYVTWPIMLRGGQYPFFTVLRRSIAVYKYDPIFTVHEASRSASPGRTACALRLATKMASMPPLAISMLLLAGTSSCCCSAHEMEVARKYQVGAFYYGPWHVDPTNEKLHGKNWSEWNLVKSAVPRFPGHEQPNEPLWGYEMDNDPVVMEKKIDAAADNGVDHFLFDWYWYNETSTNGKPGLFQDSALEDGFLKAKNRHRMEFALMWASQEWMDVHPSVGPSVSYGNRTPTFNGFNQATFEHMTDHIIKTYMSEENYLRVQTTKGGPRCLFFSIYEYGFLTGHLGGMANAKAALDNFRAKVSAAGLGCLHINSMSGAGSPADAKALGIDSSANYCWYHTTGNVLNAGRNFPVTPHAAMLNGSVKAWQDMTAKWSAAGYHYIPVTQRFPFIYTPLPVRSTLYICDDLTGGGGVYHRFCISRTFLYSGIPPPEPFPPTPFSWVDTPSLGPSVPPRRSG